MLAEGQQLSHYRLVRLLKSGGMGEVYLAVDTLLHRQVAIKVIDTDALRYAETDAAKDAARLFLREAQAIAQLDQTNILPLYDSGEQIVDGISLMYMVMPYRQAGSLADWKRIHFGEHSLPLAAVERIVYQAALALQHAHDRQIIHQDVKPSNFLVQGNADYPGELHLQLADFGVAKVMIMTSESQVIRGTPTYMAPEQWEGHPVPATDQYALAVMAYELLTGRPPFQGGLSQVMYQHFHTPPPPPSVFNPRIPGEIDAVLLRALAKRPDERFPSISAFARAFQEAVQHASAASAPATRTGSDIRATLAISTTEAPSGASRTLTLPGGRSVTVPVPAGAYDGQVIRLEGQGEPSSGGGPAGALVLTLAIRQPEEVKGLSDAGFVEKTAYASYPNLPPTIVPASDPHLQQPLTPPPPPGFEPLPPAVSARAPSAYEQTIQSSNPYLPSAFASTTPPPGSIRPGLAPARPGSGAPGPSRPKGRVILLIGLALLIIAGSVGLYSVIHANQVATATAHAHATATAAAFSATGTTQAQSIAATADAFNATATPQAQATGTATAYQDLYNSSTSGTPALSDPLHDNSIGNQWYEGTNTANGVCAFSGGAYHASESQTNTFIACDSDSTSSDFSNFAYQVQMKNIKGDAGGVVFRANDTNGKYDVFSVSQDGSYEFFVCPPNASKCNSTVLSSSSGVINQGLNQTNVVN